ncbi:phage virion morphogenesis protein [Sphingomonas cavernae]|uniref:Phage virion morphogenesis protein n=1 Tax=Sphingomonas cavernae TaxID=2320861 RepID=A0A418WP26_9SPHN|nr:phage virion morphogenesis protein [Sphingomonas cavernae]RJF92983.1 phage virion morphogenesis protein [Sphingomonas cavernae]
MSEDLAEIENWIAGLTARLSDSDRARLGRRLSVDLRHAQAERIASQRNPDGSAFEPRKPQREPLRAQKGRIQRRVKARAMFAKLRRPKYLRAESSASEISVGFEGAAARVAAVHQRGLRDRVSKQPGAPEVDYPRRELLGLTEADRARLMDAILRHLGE